jgi:hypothetical protein
MLVIFSCWLSAPALAQNRDVEARRLFQEGDRLYQEGRYEDAIVRFEESYAMSGRPLLLFNMANAYERLARYASAADALRRYLPHAAPAETDMIQTRIAMLERRAAEQQAPPPTTDPVVTPVVTDESGGLTGTQVAGVVLLGSGAALAIGGVVAALLTLDPRSQLDELCVEGTCPRAAEDPASQNTTLSILADIGMFGGAALAIGGLVLVLVGGASEAEAPPVTATVSADGAFLMAHHELP